MSIAYNTIVKAPETFIRKLLGKYFHEGCSVYAELKDNEFEILVHNFPNWAMGEVAKLSEEFTEIVFTAITTNEIEVDRAIIREVMNGEIISSKDHIAYTYLINGKDIEKIDQDTFDRFEKAANSFFNKVDLELVSKFEFDDFMELYREHHSNLVFKYPINNILIRARRKTLKEIIVDIEYDRFSLAKKRV